MTQRLFAMQFKQVLKILIIMLYHPEFYRNKKKYWFKNKYVNLCYFRVANRRNSSLGTFDWLTTGS